MEQFCIITVKSVRKESINPYGAKLRYTIAIVSTPCVGMLVLILTVYSTCRIPLRKKKSNYRGMLNISFHQSDV